MPDTTQNKALLSVRSLFVSDLHLGAPGNKAESFLNFLDNVTAANLYLVGDILDGGVALT